MNRIVEQITKMTEKVQDKETSIQRISGALNKLLKETPKKMVQLRNGLQDALNLITSYQNTGTPGTPVKLDANGVPTEPADLDKLANALVTPLKLACESHNTKMMQIALDCLHKMMDFGYIRGAAADEENPEKKLMPKVITVISSCFDSPDDNVQLQIIKAFHTAVASPICDVHETSLLNAIRCCYNICLVSRNSVNQSTAKATLTQMLHIIFSRMELQMSPDVVIGIDDSLYDLDEIEKNILKKAQLDEEPKDGKHQTTIVVHQPDSVEPAPPSDSPSSSTLDGVGSAEPVSETASDDGSSNNNVDHLAADNNNNTQSPSPMDTPRSLSRSSSAASLAEAEHNGLNGAEHLMLMKAKKSDKESFVFTDCFLVFRALCKLSTKEVPKEAQNDLNSIDMKSKILSLELILHILEHSGPVFRSFDKFINTAIKKYLIISLLLNGVSSNPKVFKLSLSIFLALVSYFKDYLKNEIGVFYGKIFLVILETANSTVQQKWMVLYALLQICKNPQALVDIFVNYDCDMDHKDVFGRMVNDLSKITKGPLGVEPSSEGKLRALALECLVNINRSLLEWTKELRQAEDQTPKQEREETPRPSAQSPETASPAEEHNKAPTDSPYRAKATGGPDFAMTRQHKIQMSKGIEKFNDNPKKGIRFLIEQGLVENNPEVIAKFFRTTEGLDKTKMGDFLGEKEDLSKAVMHSYVDLFHWQGLTIDIALRRFLETFRLPGEAQKIDRIMEKFAERYFAQNSSLGYANADAAYVLSFSIIMLSTSLHNPAIKNKMKKEEFFKQQAKLNDGKDFDKQFLSDLYDRIQAEEFKLQQSEEPKTELSADPRERKEMFQKEMERSIVKSKNLLKEKAKDRTIYYRAKQSELVKPMFEIAHDPVLQSVTTMMSESEEPEVIHLCLEGLKHSISISCTFGMESERTVCIDTLTKFTVLTNLKEMKQKNVDSIKVMIEIAKTEANYLGESWLPILRCISQLEQLHLIGSGASVEALPIPTTMPSRDNPRKSLSFRPASFINLGGNTASPSGHQRRPSSTMISSQEVLNANMIAEQIDSVAIDKIFTNSVMLNSTAIEDFVRALCQVSLDEIESPNPRLFSLQKLVELADFNMDRIRYVWSRLWNLLSNHFIKVGCENPEISVYAIDSLKQLAMKFLEKKELANFHFQKEFLKPFEFIMANQSNVKIRDMVIRCLSNMVLGKAQNIKSGWKSIFIAFTVAATDRDESIVRLAFDMAQEIIKKYFNLISEGFFVDLVNCLVAYGNGHLYIDISLKAITSLTFCAKQLAEGNVIPLIREESESNSNTEQPADNKDGIFTENDKYLGLWFPILTGLSGIVGHSHIDVRTAALTALSNVLQSYGHMFNRNFWELMFRGVLLPIFDNVSYAGGTDLFKEDNEWLTTTCLLAFNSLLALYTGFFDRISFLLSDLLNLLTNCILQENESLARIGATCFLQLVMQNGQRLTDDMWTTICTRLSVILERNTPNELVKSDTQALEVNVIQNIGTSASVTQVSSPHLKTSPSSEQLDPNADNNNTDNNSPNSPRTQAKKIPLTAAMVSKIIRGKSTVQLGLIEALNEIAFTLYPHLSTSHLLILLDSLEACYKFTYEANHNMLYRSKIEKAGLVDLLLREETTAVSSYLRVLFRMYGETTKDTENRIKISEEKLLAKLKEIIGDFVQRTAAKDKSNKSESKRILGAYAGIIVQILKGIHDFYEPQIKEHLEFLYPLLCDLISSDSKEVRNSLKKLFVKLGQIQSITK